MAKPELGTKRVCPTTGRKFYDLDKDPIVSPYTGISYSRGYFEPQVKGVAAAKAANDEEEVEVADGAVELVSLEDADAETADKDTAVVADDVDVGVEDEDEIAAEDDTFLEEDEEGDDDVADLIDGDIEGEEDT